MLKINTIEIAGIASALYALRLPFGKDCRSNVWTDFNYADDDGLLFAFTETKSTICDKDLTLMSTLVRRGDEHAKAIRGIIAYAEIEAPRFWWVEMDTYRIGSERLSSESTMHIQGRGMSTEELVKMKSELTEGTMQKRVQYFSYQALRRIYQQRRNHRLPHWHIFCDWIKTLPFANELILVGLDDVDRKEDKR
jgi:hypothetical protein